VQNTKAHTTQDVLDSGQAPWYDIMGNYAADRLAAGAAEEARAPEGARLSYLYHAKQPRTVRRGIIAVIGHEVGQDHSESGPISPVHHQSGEEDGTHSGSGDPDDLHGEQANAPGPRLRLGGQGFQGQARRPKCGEWLRTTATGFFGAASGAACSPSGIRQRDIGATSLRLHPPPGHRVVGTHRLHASHNLCPARGILYCRCCGAHFALKVEPPLAGQYEGRTNSTRKRKGQFIGAQWPHAIRTWAFRRANAPEGDPM